MDERVVLVDPDGRELGQAPRSRVRAENLLHAATAVLVRNSAGEVFVQRRSAAKDWAPSAHDVGAGGIRTVGETAAGCAARELAEELGIEGAELRPLGRARYEDEETRCVEDVFEVVWDGPVRFADAEVVWGEWMPLERLGELLADPGWPFVPDGRALLEDLARRGVGDYARLLRA